MPIMKRIIFSNEANTFHLQFVLSVFIISIVTELYMLRKIDNFVGKVKINFVLVRGEAI